MRRHLVVHKLGCVTGVTKTRKPVPSYKTQVWYRTCDWLEYCWNGI